MRHPTEGSAAQALVCRVATRLCALPIDHVIETMRPLPIAPLADVPPYVSGVAIVRGAPMPVIDAALLFGGARGVAAPARFVTIRAGARAYALAVDEVIGLRALAADDAPPPILGPSAHDVLASLGALDAELLLVVRATRMVPEAAWAQVDAAVSSSRRGAPS